MCETAAYDQMVIVSVAAAEKLGTDVEEEEVEE